MIGFTAEFANNIRDIFMNLPEKYEEVFYKILETSVDYDELYYTWDNNLGPYGDLEKLLLKNGFKVEVDYEDYYNTGLVINW